MMLKNQIMKLQTYKMYEGEDTVYVERDDVLKLLEQQPTPRNNLEITSQDCIIREEAIRIAEQGQIQGYEWQFKELCNLSSVTPSIPDVENNFNLGYNCGYADAMSDISERR